MASLLERTGCSRGLGWFDAFFDNTTSHEYGVTPLWAAHIPLAVGLGFRQSITWRRSCHLCFFCDGAINSGAFPALNLRLSNILPDRFSVKTTFFRNGTFRAAINLAQADRRSLRKVTTFPGEIVDGMNFREVRDEGCRDLYIPSEGTASGFPEMRTIVSAATRCRTRQVTDETGLEKYRLDYPITRLRASSRARENYRTNIRSA